MESSGSHGSERGTKEEKVRRGTGGDPDAQTTENLRGGHHGTRPTPETTNEGGRGGFRFLEGPLKPPVQAFAIICGTSRKGKHENSSAKTTKKPKKEPRSGN